MVQHSRVQAYDIAQGYEHSFFVATTKSWNKLTANIINAPFPGAFMHGLEDLQH